MPLGLSTSIVKLDTIQGPIIANRVTYASEKSISLDGINDSVHLPSGTDFANLLGDGDFSISYWVKADTFDDGTTTSRGWGLGTNLEVIDSQVRQISLGTIYGANYGASALRDKFEFMLYNSGTAGNYYVNYTRNVTGLIYDGQWNHVLISCRKNASNRTVEAWINGVSLGVTTSGSSASFTGVSFASNPAHISLANISSVGNAYYKQGQYDEILIMHATSNQSIADAIYNGNVQVDESGRDDVEAYYLFEDDTSDQIGSNPAFVNNGAVFSEDKPDGESFSLSFDGVNDYAYIGNPTGNTLQSTLGDGPFSISYWMKMNEISFGGSGSKHTLGSNLITTPSFNQLTIGSIAGTGHPSPAYRSSLQFHCYVNSNVVFSHVSPPLTSISGVSDNEWFHVVYVSGLQQTPGGPRRTGQVYINGSAVTTSSPVSPSATTDFSSQDLGAQLLMAAQIFNASSVSGYTKVGIDEVSWWDAALSASTVSDIYNNGIPADESQRAKLAGYWRMEDNGNDDSPNSNTLTRVGAAFTRDIPTG